MAPSGAIFIFGSFFCAAGPRLHDAGKLWNLHINSACNLSVEIPHGLPIKLSRALRPAIPQSGYSARHQRQLL